MRFILSGYGNMGKMIEDVLKGHPDTEIVAKIDIDEKSVLSESTKIADVIMDFSHPAMFDELLDYAARTTTPLVCGTTGLSEQQKRRFAELGEIIPVVYSTNYSYGIAVLRKALVLLASNLGSAFSSNLGNGWDMELTETHHNCKADAPSGTALSLLDCLDPEHRYARVYGREGMCGKRDRKEIGVHSVRGGTEAGEHTVAFFGTDEMLSITHRASSRRIFAEGAARAAQKLTSKPAGIYTFDEIMF